MRPYRHKADLGCVGVWRHLLRAAGALALTTRIVRLLARSGQAGHRHRCSAGLQVHDIQGRRGRTSLARLVGRVPFRGAHPAHAGSPERESRHRDRDLPDPAGRRPGPDHRGGPAAAHRLQCERHRDQDVAATRHRVRQHARRRWWGLALFAALLDLAERELHHRFLGQEPGGAEGDGRDRRGEPVQQGGGGADRARFGRQHLFLGPGGAGPPAHRAPQPHRRDAHPRPHQAAVRRRHFLRPQRRAAGEPRRAGARQHPDLRAAPASEHHGARRAGRAHAGTLLGEGQLAHRHHDAADNARPAVIDSVPAAGHPAGRVSAAIVDLQRAVRTRRLLPHHPAHRQPRLPERSVAYAVRPGSLGLHRRGWPHPADFRRRRADGAARAAEGSAGSISADLSQDGACGLFERRAVADRRSADDRGGNDPGAGGEQLPPRLRSVGTAAQGGHDQSRDAAFRPRRRCSPPRTQLAIDRFNHMLAVVSLFQSLGGGWPPGPPGPREPRPRDPFGAFWVPLD